MDDFLQSIARGLVVGVVLVAILVAAWSVSLQVMPTPKYLCPAGAVMVPCNIDLYGRD